MHEGPVETVKYIWASIWCMPDWIIGFCHTVDHSGTQLINYRGVHKIRRCCVEIQTLCKPEQMMAQYFEMRICILGAELKMDASQTAKE